MTNKLKVGLVGADAAGRSWGPVSHIPALHGIEQIELAALCTSRPESAAAAAEAFGVDRAYHDINELVAQPDLDIVAAVVNIPSHYEIVVPALNAGKHVYCEWPLGASLAETEEMAALAQDKGVVTAIGLQGRHDPSLTYIKELCDEGWLGDIHSIQVTFLGRSTPDRSSRMEYEREVHRGAHLLTIIGGHTLAYIAYCFGPLAEVSARVATRVKKLRMADTGEMVDAEAADNVLINGELTSGALLSYQLSAVPFHGDGWRMAVYGSKGTIIATAEGLPQITPIKLVGAQGDEPLVELPVPERLRVVPESVPFGPPQNVGQAYVRMAAAIQEGKAFAPSFEDALEVHRLLDAIQQSSDEGRVVRVV
ncbi:Gfo/Idh/MocA family protein [Haloferax sp. YSMS24]|uniref:Gfo/Idh/MocA family protein n=1 Tax=Haloferax sp. YSMS24 TaxID=3388425 RepID=UPI00398D2A3A